MRVDYTLPALQPEVGLEAQEISPEGGQSFQQLIRAENVALPTTVDQTLRLDARPYTGTYIGPPPRPRTLGVMDAESQRQSWQGMLRKHSQSSGNLTRVGMGRGQPVHNMLQMLQEMQQMEDSIVSQAVALTRG